MLSYCSFEISFDIGSRNTANLDLADLDKRPFKELEDPFKDHHGAGLNRERCRPSPCCAQERIAWLPDLNLDLVFPSAESLDGEFFSGFIDASADFLKGIHGTLRGKNLGK